jgi:hypothetical protein
VITREAAIGEMAATQIIFLRSAVAFRDHTPRERTFTVGIHAFATATRQPTSEA